MPGRWTHGLKLVGGGMSGAGQGEKTDWADPALGHIIIAL